MQQRPAILIVPLPMPKWCTNKAALLCILASTPETALKTQHGTFFIVGQVSIKLLDSEKQKSNQSKNLLEKALTDIYLNFDQPSGRDFN